MKSSTNILYIDPALDLLLAPDFLSSIKCTLVDDPSDATHALLLAETGNNLQRLSDWSHLKKIVVSDEDQIAKHLLLYPNAIQGIVFSPIRARVVQALMDASNSRSDTVGSTQQAIGLVQAGSTRMYRQSQSSPFLYTDVNSTDELDLRTVKNSELIYQGFSVVHGDGALIPIEAGAPFIIYNNSNVLSNTLAHASAGYILRANENRESSATGPTIDDGYVSQDVFEFLARQEAIRSERTKRPYTLLNIHLPYEKAIREPVLELIRTTLRTSDAVEITRDSTVRIFCPETNYFEAFWLVHRLQDAIHNGYFKESLTSSLEKPTFQFWTHPEFRSSQPDSMAYPRQLKDWLFPARREFWQVFDSLASKFSAFLEPIDLGGTHLWDLLGVELALANAREINNTRIFVHVGHTQNVINAYLPIIRQKPLREFVEISGFVQDEPPSNVHALPFQPISDERCANLEFFTVQSQEHNYLVCTYKTEGTTESFIADDPWLVDLFYTSFSHTYFLRNRPSQ